MATQDEQDRVNWIKNLIQLMCCDGRIADREKAFLRKIADQLKVKFPDWNLLLKCVLHNARVRYPISDEATALAALKSLIVTGNADGKIDDNEKRYILSFAKVLNLSSRQLKDVVKDMAQTSARKEEPAFVPSAASQAAAHIAAAKDDFDLLDDFIEVARELGRTVAVTTVDNLISGKTPSAGIVCFHAAAQPADTIARCKLLQGVASLPLVGVLTRHQGHHVRYLLELNIPKCVIEPIYPRDVEQICALA